MAVGSFLLGGVADQFGRRRSILTFLRRHDARQLHVFARRHSAGSGLLAFHHRAWHRRHAGGNQRRLGGIFQRSPAQPVGGADDHRLSTGQCLLRAAGLELLKTHNWRVVFEFAAILSAVLFPVVWFGVPESISWLCRKQPAGALEKDQHNPQANGTCRDRSAAALPPPAQRPSFKDLFTPLLMRLTLLMVVAYFAHITSFYYIIKWVAPIASDMGYSVRSWPTCCCGSALVVPRAARCSVCWRCAGAFACSRWASWC